MTDNNKNFPLHLSRRAFVSTGSALLALSSVGRFSRSLGASTPIVETSSGQLRGVIDNGVHTFKGIPYGASTAGAARFMPPQKTQPWSGVREATSFGSRCPQPEAAPLFGIDRGSAQFREDCLVLNVWTPGTDSDSSARPVMVWLHGGGFETGSGEANWTNGANLARKQDVVVVAINHRLNVFGYLYLGEIGGEQYADSGNAGMLDIAQALVWVRDNIARFGGDPKRVMIFGESGGGRKVSTMMAYTPARGLFHRAAVQSGSALRMDSKSYATQRAQRLLAVLQIQPKDFRKLHDVPTDALVKAASQVSKETGQFRPLVDGRSLQRNPFDPDAPPFSAEVPMIIGTNRTEASLYLGPDPVVQKLDDAGFKERLKAMVPAGQSERVYEKYKQLFPKASAPDLMYMAATDRSYFLDSTIQAERKAAQGHAPIYYYNLHWSTPIEAGRYHTPHALDLPFVFNNLASAPGYVGQVTPQMQALADSMSGAWAAFARSGDPNVAGQLQWPRYDVKQRATMIFDTPPRIENDPRGEQRKLMLEFGSEQAAEREPKRIG